MYLRKEAQCPLPLLLLVSSLWISAKGVHRLAIHWRKRWGGWRWRGQIWKRTLQIDIQHHQQKHYATATCCRIPWPELSVLYYSAVHQTHYFATCTGFRLDTELPTKLLLQLSRHCFTTNPPTSTRCSTLTLQLVGYCRQALVYWWIGTHLTKHQVGHSPSQQQLHGISFHIKSERLLYHRTTVSYLKTHLFNLDWSRGSLPVAPNRRSNWWTTALSRKSND